MAILSGDGSYLSEDETGRTCDLNMEKDRSGICTLGFSPDFSSRSNERSESSSSWPIFAFLKASAMFSLVKAGVTYSSPPDATSLASLSC